MKKLLLLLVGLSLVSFVSQDFGRMDDKQVQREMRQNSPERDQILAHQIQEVLDATYGASKIGVEVHSSQVTLRGTVNSLKESSEIENRVRRVEGVNAVLNYITVQSPVPVI